MKTTEIKGKNTTHLYFPLGQMGKSESIFEDANNGVFQEKYQPIMAHIIGKQLAVNIYYQNDLIAAANTKISIELLKIFDDYKINFKVNKNDVTAEARDHALDLAMTELIKCKRTFLDTLKNENIPVMQKKVHQFITRTISGYSIPIFKDHYGELKGYLDFANSAITSDDKYIATAAALKKIIETEKKLFSLGKDQVGETLIHVIKTAWISLLLSQQLDDFSEQDYKKLCIICLGHDGGKALIPEEVIYKKGRLTQLENDIMKSHVLLSYILSSNNQLDLNPEAFIMAMHHIKEDKNSPQSYSIANDTHTSYYQYLTAEAQTKLNEIYYSARKFYRVIAIADTFEAITAERVYKKGSSMGKALEIMISSNKKSECFYQPYLDAFVKFIITTYFPENLQFKIDNTLMQEYYPAEEQDTPKNNLYKRNHRGVILKSCSSLEQNLHCMIYNIQTQQIDRNLTIPPLFFLQQRFF